MGQRDKPPVSGLTFNNCELEKILNFVLISQRVGFQGIRKATIINIGR
jgi:hypothetical protein